MNAPAEAGAAQAANRGGGPRGRGRGGLRGNGRGSVTGRAAPKVQTAKIGPTRLLEVDWTKDSILKDNCFVIWLGTGQAGDQQWTIHRPIGETPLKPTDWVATPSRDIHFLLLRRESEALAAWKRQGELAKRQWVLHLQRGRRLSDDGQTEVWTFDGAPEIQPTIRTCMSAAKAAGAKESEWLSYADPAVRGAEQTFKDTLKSQPIPAGWIRVNPMPVHETKGGPLGDVPQRAVTHLSGCSLSAAKDRCLMAAIGLTPPGVPVDSENAPDPESEESEAEEEVVEVKPPKLPSPKSANAEDGGKTPTQPKAGAAPKTPSPKGKEPSPSTSPKK
jgi:hypothetical protein